VPASLNELVAEVAEVDILGPAALGTAQWMGSREATKNLFYSTKIPSDRIWLGTAWNNPGAEMGYADDRHVTLVSGTRGGKGTGIIVPTLSLWPGSCIVIDPKGENAAITARRRGQGASHIRGLGQHVCILDPFREIVGLDDLQARFNPLDVIASGDLAVDDAGRMAAAIVVKENQNDPYWEDAARNLVKCLILHVLTWDAFKGRRNLLTVRTLLMSGDIFSVDLAIQAGVAPNDAPTPAKMLQNTLLNNKAFNGIIAGAGARLKEMPDKMRMGVMEIACTNTAFIDGPPMQRLLETSDFKLDELKTNPQGFSLYLTLPARYMEDHFRWLRLMVTLAIGEMERVKGKPATKHRTLFLLDEFAGLKRMEPVENAVAQAAGFGLKFFFVLQNLPQLKRIYDDAWENFISNSGLKIFFQVDDQFTREYLSKLLGEREVRRQTQSGTSTSTQSHTVTDGDNYSSNQSTARARSKGDSESTSHGSGGLFPNRQFGKNNSDSITESFGSSAGTNHSVARGDSTSEATGIGESVHKRPLLTPDEIGLCLSRMTDKQDSRYPGAIVAIIPGMHPLLARRINYYESKIFAGLYDRHPEHDDPSGPTAHVSSQTIQGVIQNIDWRGSAAAVGRAARIAGGIAAWAWNSVLIARLAKLAAVMIVGYLGYPLVGRAWSQASEALSQINLPKFSMFLPDISGRPKDKVPAPVPSVLAELTPDLSKIIGDTHVPQPSARQGMAAPLASKNSAGISVAQLTALAQKATDYFYWYHGSDAGPDMTGLRDLYAPVVNFYGRDRRADDFIREKKAIASSWPIRHFFYTEQPHIDCDTTNLSCTVTGHVQFKFENADRTSNGISSFNLTFSNLGGRSQIMAESGKVEQRF